MADQPDWTLVTWEGNRRRQHREFQALTFREKLRVIESLGEVTAFFARRAKARVAAVREPRGTR
jgi:hypothetical protein